MPNSNRLDYNTLDVFTTAPFAGNQIGLVHLPASLPLSQTQKQAMAIEFNYSETVILHERASDAPTATYSAQIFTPKSELPFAGHPTIGTAVWIFENLERERDAITINLKAGTVKATYDRAKGVATAAIPHNVRVHGKRVAWDRVAANQPAIGAESVPDELRTATMPISSIVTGVTFVLVDLSAGPELLKHAKPTAADILTLEDLDEDMAEGLVGSLFYRIYPDQGDGVVRIRQRMMGIGLEDPATGSASGALTSYLALQRGGKRERYRFEIEQGVEMGRASKIYVDVTLDESGSKVEKVELKGQAVEIMKGQMIVPK